ncbi:MAG TPA: hypothetical protein VJL59_13145 [Anaerolineales bacterium]|nr:hypothetical protein [Anaerolineales bacterium]
MIKHIGRSQRSSTTGFVFGCSVPEPEVPLFGSFVKAPIQKQQAEAIGLIYNIVVEDDQFVRPMISAGDQMPDDEFEAYLQDQRQNRNVPIEVSVLTVGYRNGAGFIHSLPPQPPMLLDKIHYCAEDEIRSFTERFDYLGLILEAPDVPADELIAVSLLKAAEVQPNRTRFLQTAGRELAKMMTRDLARLEKLLRRIKP